MTAARCGGKRVGYIPVSTLDKETDRQLEGIALNKLFADKATERRQLDTMLQYLGDVDVIVVRSICRRSPCA